MSSHLSSFVRVVLSEDHNIIRHAMKAILESGGRYRVVAEAATADDTIDILKNTEAELLLLDLALPGKNGIEVLHELRNTGSNVKVCILTMYDDPTKALQAFAAGARAFIPKNSSPRELLDALERVMRGEWYVPEQLGGIRSKIEPLLSSPRRVLPDDPLVKLSRREREIFYMLADGVPNRIIAQKLVISPRTVETHRARVIKKLGFHSTADLIRYAIRNELLTA